MDPEGPDTTNLSEAALAGLRKRRHIAVDGPPGVGKTHFARRLAEVVGGKLVLDPASRSPYLDRLGTDPDRYAFPAQCRFLIDRCEQQRDLLSQDIVSTTVVSNYLQAKDRIYAYLNLDDEELALYERVHGYVAVDALRPDLVVFLHANARQLALRIRSRRFASESWISETYLEKVVQGYHTFLFQYSATPVLVVDTEGIDISHDRRAADELVEEAGLLSDGKKNYVLRRR
ncbi:deoxynucleoside kinase [Candidatus Poribacteria bacterium]|nr:deoxynucleoside kinase [Candidatus Poribacteria bacterium]